MKKTSVWMVRVLALLMLLTALPAFAQPRGKAVMPARYIKMSEKSLTMTLSSPEPAVHQLSVKVDPEEALLTQKVIWSSDDESIARVDANGLVTAVGKGTTKIRASIEGASKTLEVACKVKVKLIKVKSIKLDTDSVLLDLEKSGERTASLTATVLPANASLRAVTWTSSNPSVATVKGGVVTAVSKGKCVITASCQNGEKTAKADVTCLNKSQMIAVTFTAGGDIVLGGDKHKKSDQRFERMISQSGAPDYSYTLKNLKPIFEKDDFSYLNLEGPLKGGGSPGKPDREFNFYGKPEYVNILKEGSVEVANVVNNHIADYGTKPATLAILRSAGILIADKDVNVYTFNGVRFGFIGYVTPVGTGTIYNKAKAAKEKCDVLVVSFHFCSVPEHKHTLKLSQVNLARAAINGGADLVLGHHTHVPSGIQVYKGKYIYYGLGSVESCGWRFGRKDIYNTFLAQQKILFDPDTGFVFSEVPTLYPLCPTGAPVKQPNNCQPILLPPSDPRYDYVFKVIDNNSSTGGLTPAPYIKGHP